MHQERSQPGFVTRRARRVAGNFAALILLAAAVRGATQADVPEGVGVSVRVEPQSATVGDPIRVLVEVTHPSAIRVEIPKPGSQLGDFSVLTFAQGAAQRIEGSPTVRDTATVVVAAYKTGALDLPGICFKVVAADGRELTAATAPSRIRIQSVLSGTNPELKGLKKQAEIDEPFPFLRWLALLAAVAAALAVAWWRLRRRRPSRIAAAAQPRLDPLEVAEVELRDLISRGLPEKGFVKQFYVALSDVARKMLDGGYEIPTAEKTTTEIVEALRDTALPPPDPGRLGRIEALLDACDLVKFAKYVPGRDEIEAVTKAAFELLDHCRQRRAAAPAAGVGTTVGAA